MKKNNNNNNNNKKKIYLFHDEKFTGSILFKKTKKRFNKFTTTTTTTTKLQLKLQKTKMEMENGISSNLIFTF